MERVMRSARIAAAGVLCFALSACGVFEKRKESTEAPRRVPPHLATPAGTPAPLPSGPVAKVDAYPVAETEKVFRGDTAVREIQPRQPAGGSVNSLSWKDGKMTVKTKYPDGSSMSIISGDNGNQIEYRPAK